MVVQCSGGRYSTAHLFPSAARLRAEFGERLGAADADEEVALANLGVARRVEDHLAALPADGGDDDVEGRADGRVLQLAARQRRAGRDLDLLEGEVEALGRDRVHEVRDRGLQ